MTSESSASHQHALPGTTNTRALALALALTGTFLIAEVVAAFAFGSLALLSDAAHMLTDAAALAIALAAVRIARRPADRKRTYGYHRFEILAAAFNALMLFAVAGYILFEAWQRWRAPSEVQSIGMLLVASLGLVINFISLRLLTAGKDRSLNVKGAYLEVWSDLLGSIGVIGAALVIKATGWVWVDTAVAVAIGLWVLPRTWILLRDSLNILLEGVPEGVDLAAIETGLLRIDDVASIHDLHVWALTSGRTAATVHLVYRDGADPGDVLDKVRQSLSNLFGMAHTTVQLEARDCREAEQDDAHAAEPADHDGAQRSTSPNTKGPH
jgi:cobalt-zinc-cadmium efflux system protein